MKLILVLLTGFVSFSAQAALNCRNVTSGQGGLVLQFSNDLSVVAVTIVGAAGESEATGTLNCSGPQESAYLCSGALGSLTVSEGTLQGGAGPVSSGSVQYRCVTR